MVGIVIISHSRELADCVVEYTRIMADGANVIAAGGTEEGNRKGVYDFGTSYDRIYHAVETVYSEDGVILLVDLGSAVMKAEMVIEAFGRDNVLLADCPLVEGAVVATINSLANESQAQIMEALSKVAATKKF